MATEFTEEDWQEEIKEWKEMGIQYIVIGETAYKNEDGWYTYYPSKIKGTKMYYDSVSTILKHCKEANVKVFVSCGNNPSAANLCRYDKDTFNGQGQETFLKSIETTLPFIQEVYDLYYKEYKDIWYGWYFTPEVSNNIDFEDPTYLKIGVETLSKSLNMTIEKIRELNPKFNIMLSPYLNVEETATWCTRDTNVITNFWKEVINNTKFIEGDVLAPQDSCNNMKWDYNKLDKYTKCYRDAIDGANKKIQLWMNLELTIGLDPNDEETKYVEKTQSTFVNRLIQQIETEKKYSDGFMTYSFCFYYTKPNAIDGFYDTYRDYLKTGILESEPPSEPTDIATSTINLQGKNVLNIKFSGMNDNYGIARAEIYKNNKLFTYRVSTRKETYFLGNKLGKKEPDEFFDQNFDLNNDKATYEIYVYDCAGNKSNNSLKFEVYAKNGNITYKIL